MPDFSKTTIYHATNAELKTNEIREQFIVFNKKINECLSSTNFVHHGLTNMLYEEDKEEDLLDINKGIDKMLAL
eukprot:5487486-Ditylum_brightwellii.AAC.1